MTTQQASFKIRRARPAPGRRLTSRTRLAAHMTAVLALLTATALSLAPAAPARAWYSHGGSGGEPGGQAAAEVGLHWYDITSETIAAAAYPESVTQSRASSVNWLAAARAVRSL